jgi:antagonist of KipI
LESNGPSITVLQPGLLTTVQDSGRWGYQDKGVPVAGAMDSASYRLANLLVGNPPDAAALEATLIGPSLRMDSDMVFSLTGADLSATLDGAPLPLRHAVGCRRGSVLRFGDRQTGARTYVAFAGGIDIPAILGSRSTHVLSQLGGINGHALRAGDCLPIGPPAGHPRRHVPPMRQPSGGARLRVLPGPQSEFFDPAMFEALQQTRFTISSQSDRMGYRLIGRSPISASHDGEMISDAAFMGSVQVPPSGDPILLMADRPTTGGYPQIATVITADLPLAGQLAPGDWIEFNICTRAEAVAALIAQEKELLAVR